MKEVQRALSEIGIPVFPDVWRPLEGENAPGQYVVYVTRSIEQDFWDGLPHTLKTFVYMNLWSDSSPVAMAETIKKKMWKAGFELVDELTGSSVNATRYDEETKRYCVSLDWVILLDYTRPTDA